MRHGGVLPPLIAGCPFWGGAVYNERRRLLKNSITHVARDMHKKGHQALHYPGDEGVLEFSAKNKDGKEDQEACAIDCRILPLIRCVQFDDE